MQDGSVVWPFLVQGQPDRRYLKVTRKPLYTNYFLVLQVLSDVLPLCEPGLCCADTPEDPKLAASVQILSLVSTSEPMSQVP